VSGYQPDEVIEEHALISADALTAAGLKPSSQRGSDGRPLFLWPADRDAIELPCPRDISEFDEIALPCSVPEDAGTRLALAMEMSSLTPGMNVVDSCWGWAPLGNRAREPRFGPQEARF
jgi:hypothetical protein